MAVPPPGTADIDTTETGLIRVLSHTGNSADANSLEYLVLWEDGTTSYMWHRDICDTVAFDEYLFDHQELSQVDIPFVIPRRTSPASSTKAHAPPAAPTRRSQRLNSAFSVLLTDPSTDIDAPPSVPISLPTLKSRSTPAIISKFPGESMSFAAIIAEHVAIMATKHGLTQLKALIATATASPAVSPATACSSQYARTFAFVSTMPTLPAAPYVLRPPPKGSPIEFSVEAGLHMHPKEAKKAMAKEMDKMEARFGVFAPTATAYSDIPADAVKVYGHMFLKYKYHSDGSHRVDDDGDMLISARLYADGSHQPPDSYHDTYAGTADDTCKQAFIAAYGARAKKFNIINDLEIFSFDVPGAFLQVKFTHENCPKPIYMKLPANVNHRFAGKWVLLLGALYGLKPSNHLFDKDLTATLALAQFYPSPEDPKIFHRAHPTDPQLSVTVSMHVDDGLGCSLYKPYKEELKRVLTARYGTMEWDDNDTNTLFKE
jgi:hypothetical protein